MTREEYGTDGNIYQMSISNGKKYSSEPNYNEWCTDCKEYDHERHCCPRFNRVIQNTLKEMEVQPERSKGVFTRQELEDWLYSICRNNIIDTKFCKDVEEIISRLDGFEKYVEDMRGE